MANLAEQLTALLNKAGVTNEDPTLINIQKMLATVEVPENYLNESIGKAGYTTIEAARNNPELTKHFRATVLNGLDSELSKSYIDLGLDETTIAKLNDEKNSFKRATMLATIVKDLESSKAKASTGDKAEYQKKIDELNNQILSEKGLRESEKQSIKNEYEQKFTELHITNMLASKNLTDSAKEESFLLARTKLNRTLSEKNLQVVNENGGLKLMTKDGLEYFDNNVKVDLNTFADKVLAENKYIVTAAAQPSTQPTKTIPTTTNGVNFSSYENATPPTMLG